MKIMKIKKHEFPNTDRSTYFEVETDEKTEGGDSICEVFIGDYWEEIENGEEKFIKKLRENSANRKLKEKEIEEVQITKELKKYKDKEV